MAELVKTTNATVEDIATVTKTALNAKKAIDAVSEKIDPINLNNLLTKDDYSQFNGVLPLDNNGQFVAGKAVNRHIWLNYGYIVGDKGVLQPDINCIQVHHQYLVRANTDTAGMTLQEVYWTQDGQNSYKSIVYRGVVPDQDGSSDLGMSDHAWGTIYVKAGVNITSDKREKTRASSLASSESSDNQKLMNVVYTLNTNRYKLNQAISKKGEANAKMHVGFIAQDVEQALNDAALSAADYAM